MLHLLLAMRRGVRAPTNQCSAGQSPAKDRFISVPQLVQFGRCGVFTEFLRNYVKSLMPTRFQWGDLERIGLSRRYTPPTR